MDSTPPLYGVDYYPEQWPEERWKEDARLMKEAGIQVVRLAEFSWSAIEPSEGQYSFSWLDRAVDVLTKHGIQLMLSTPTACPPPWFTSKYPDALRVNSNGIKMNPGSRRQMCANNPEYCRASQQITSAIVQRYGRDPRVVGWQLDNEYGCHDTIRCLCDNCQEAFREWLQESYSSLDHLNTAWGTAFWSLTYTDWSQIPLPRASPADHNPALMLDYYRFSSDSWAAFNKMLADTVRQHAPSHLITHNLMIFFFHYDHFKVASELDFVSWDNYHHTGAQPVTVAANHDLVWGARQRNFWVIEQQAGQVNWSRYNPLMPPGMLTLKVLQAIGHGADGILFFRWRQARFGAEMYHSGLLDHAARPTRAFYEAAALGKYWLVLMDQLKNTQPDHQAAILLDFESAWALELQPQTELLDMKQKPGPAACRLLWAGGEPLVSQPPSNSSSVYFMQYYEALWRNNIQCAIIDHDSESLDRYRALFAPYLHIASNDTATRLLHWVQQGGILFVGPRAGYKNTNNALWDVPQPGPLTTLLGGTVREFDTLEPEERITLVFEDGKRKKKFPVGVWCEAWEPSSPNCQVVATYDVGHAPEKLHMQGTGAVLLTRHGKGWVLTIGTFGGWELFEYVAFGAFADRFVRTDQSGASVPSPAAPAANQRSHWSSWFPVPSFLNPMSIAPSLTGRGRSGAGSPAPVQQVPPPIAVPPGPNQSGASATGLPSTSTAASASPLVKTSTSSAGQPGSVSSQGATSSTPAEQTVPSVLTPSTTPPGTPPLPSAAATTASPGGTPTSIATSTTSSASRLAATTTTAVGRHQAPNLCDIIPITPLNVEALCRGNGRILFLLNHTCQEQKVDLVGEWEEVVPHHQLGAFASGAVPCTSVPKDFLKRMSDSEPKMVKVTLAPYVGLVLRRVLS